MTCSFPCCLCSSADSTVADFLLRGFFHELSPLERNLLFSVFQAILSLGMGYLELVFCLCSFILPLPVSATQLCHRYKNSFLSQYHSCQISPSVSCILSAVRSYRKPHRSIQDLKGVSHDRLGSISTFTWSNTRDAICRSSFFFITRSSTPTVSPYYPMCPYACHLICNFLERHKSFLVRVAPSLYICIPLFLIPYLWERFF